MAMSPIKSDTTAKKIKVYFSHLFIRQVSDGIKHIVFNQMVNAIHRVIDERYPIRGNIAGCSIVLFIVFLFSFYLRK